MTDMLEELRRIREAMELVCEAVARIEGQLRVEPITCRGCSSVFRTREEYEGHQCGLGERRYVPVVPPIGHKGKMTEAQMTVAVELFRERYPDV